jgi:predicted Ser/Thr protein kinase
MIATEPHLAALSDEHRRELESWLVEFDEGWDDTRLAAWVRKLPASGSPLRRPALIEMVKIDLERRWEHGKQVSLEAYLKKLPELGTADLVPVDLILAECEVRQQFGVPVNLADFTKRFPRQAKDLRQFVQKHPTHCPELPPVPSTRRTVSPSSGTPLPGQPVAAAASLPEQFGRYRIVRKLGQGGMGSVYLAYDGQLEREVALKVPHFAVDDGPELLERFYREARAAATLTHPNICPVYDVGEIDGIRFLTMAYIEGRPLSEVIQEDAPLPEGQVAALIHTLALALHEAHLKAVIHRDLKPSNIMINQRQEPMIMDFGLARKVRQDDVRLTRSGTPLGTPAYMPPEQITGDVHAMGPGCDIYSLGVILYELLTRRRPFEGTLAVVWGQILTQDPPRPSEHRPELDPRLEAICLKAMAKKVEERYATMAEMAAALNEFLHVQTPTSGPQVFADLGGEESAIVRTPRRQAGRGRRGPRWKWLAVGGAAAAAVLLSVSIIVRTRHGKVTIVTDDENTVAEAKQADSGDEKRAKEEAKTKRPSNPVKSDLDAFDYYARGLPGVWQTMMDSRGKIMTGGAPWLSTDGLELVFWKPHSEDRGGRDLYIGRRDSVSEPFGVAVHQAETSTTGSEGIPTFTNDDLTLYFLNKAVSGAPHTVMWATRPRRGVSFGPSRVLADFPIVWANASRFSPDGRICFYTVPGDTVCHRAVRRADGKSFDLQETNLPRLQEGVQSELWTVAVSNKGSGLFTQDAQGKIWLVGARCRGGPQDYETTRLLDLHLPSPWTHVFTCCVSQDARLLLGWLNNELIAMRLPEDVREKVLSLLD